MCFFPFTAAAAGDASSSVAEFESVCASVGQEAQCCVVGIVSGFFHH